MSVIRFQYNSRHKIIIAGIVLAVSVWQFWGRSSGEEFYPNGQIKQQGSMRNNKNEGIWTWYYPNGSVRMKGFFENGKREGKWIFNDLQGRTTADGNYVGDKLNGWYTHYDTAGNEVSKTWYVNDEVAEKPAQ